MPGWNIHLEAGERLANKLHLSPAKKQEFLLGCILPDFNNGYVNNPKVVKEHEETHYAHNQKSSLNFYAENKAEIDAREPIYLGYLLHLYTDGYFNFNFYHRYKRSNCDQSLTREEKREIKHHDFWLFDDNFRHNLGIKSRTEAERLARIANHIAAIDITADDILEVEHILKNADLNHAVRGSEYIFYTESELSQLMNNMIKDFTKQYLKGGHHA